MKFFNITKIILLSITIYGCTLSKSTKMNIEDHTSFSCDVNTGSCKADLGAVTNVSLTTEAPVATKIKINYYYDALCGWCYGFSPVIQQLQEAYGNRIDIDVISGGLFLGQRAGKVNNVAPHIKLGAYKSVEQLTQVKFGKTFLDDVFGNGDMILNSLPPSMALCIVREAYPENEVEFAAALLKAVYFDGINPIDIDAYIPYVEKYGISKQVFLEKMNSPVYKEMAIEEFKTFSKSDYSGMPSITVVKEGKEIPITNGFVNYNQLKTRLDQFLN